MSADSWRKLRWFAAVAVVVAGATLLLVSTMTSQLQTCSVITSASQAPSAAQGFAEQSVLRLPLRLCQPISLWVVLPFAVVALLLLLPDYRKVGLGGLSLERFEERLAERLDERLDEVKSDIQSTLQAAAGVTKDQASGTIHKGHIRNVELRVKTVQRLLIDALVAVPAGELPDRLYDAGRQWGADWSEEFTAIERGTGRGRPDGPRRLLADWAFYDSSAGMGRIDFELDDDGEPVRATVTRNFLAVEQQGVDLRVVTAGYIAGSLDGLLPLAGRHRRVVLSDKDAERDTYTIQLVATTAPGTPSQATRPDGRPTGGTAPG